MSKFYRPLAKAQAAGDGNLRTDALKRAANSILLKSPKEWD
jgi:hypothetical protein